MPQQRELTLIIELYIKKLTITLKVRFVSENSRFLFKIRYAEFIGHYLSSLKIDEPRILLITFLFILSKTSFTRRDGVLQFKCQSLGLEGSIMGYNTGPRREYNGV